jgi:type II secretory pathway component GspD/PulD (secretin)
LFSNQSNAVIRNELILLVTPKIIHRSLTSNVTEEYLKRRSYHPTSVDRDAGLNTFPKQEVLMNPLPQVKLSAQPAAVEDGEPPLETIPDLTLTPAE